MLSRSAAPAAQAGDKRRSLRRDGNPVTVLIADSLNSDKSVQGQVLDRTRRLILVGTAADPRRGPAHRAYAGFS
jgi:hypothetical protein